MLIQYFNLGFNVTQNRTQLMQNHKKALLWKALDYYKYMTNCYCHASNFVSSYYPNFTLTLSGEKIIISFLYWTEISSQSKYNHVKKEQECRITVAIKISEMTNRVSVYIYHYSPPLRESKASSSMGPFVRLTPATFLLFQKIIFFYVKDQLTSTSLVFTGENFVPP